MTERIGQYRIIGWDQLPSDDPQMLVLDTNVAIDIEAFYFGDTERKFDRDALRELLVTFAFSQVESEMADINYRWAACETAWARDGSFRDTKVRSLRRAVDVVIHWEPEKVEKWFRASQPPWMRDKKWPTIPLPDPKRERLPDPHLFSSYAAILYLTNTFLSETEWSSRDVRVAVESYLDWMKNHLGVRGAYEFAAAISLFTGTPAEVGAARKLMKLKELRRLANREQLSPDKLADYAWNAAWDITFVRTVDRMQLGAEPGFAAQRACLVTRNDDPWALRQKTRVYAAIDMGNGNVFPWLGSVWDSDWADVSKFWTREEFTEMISMSPNEEMARNSRDQTELLAQMLRALVNLETRLGVTHSAAQAYGPRLR
ncbi:hypothetical protein [Mycobacteroides abscessus]|uniref:hypothetical protein n=2 Tax=Mycobacteroides abscessus TaxID=36809 RepID=UPI0018968119